MKSISSFPTQTPRGGPRLSGSFCLNLEGLCLKRELPLCPAALRPHAPLQAPVGLEPPWGRGPVEPAHMTGDRVPRAHADVCCAGVLASGDRVSSRWGLPAPWGCREGTGSWQKPRRPLQPSNSPHGLDPEEPRPQEMRSHLDIPRWETKTPARRGRVTFANVWSDKSQLPRKGIYVFRSHMNTQIRIIDGRLALERRWANPEDRTRIPTSGGSPGGRGKGVGPGGAEKGLQAAFGLFYFS